MNKCYAYALAFAMAAVSTAEATEEAMNAALKHWEQQMTEYQAALDSAANDEARAAIHPPDGLEVSKALWKAISAKTGTRKKVIKGTSGQTLNAEKDKTLTVPTYEFEQKWAAPAVIWFIRSPQYLAEIYQGRENELPAYAGALLDAIHEHHYANPLMAEVCDKITESASVRSYELLEKIYTYNPDRNARGCAALGMSILLGNPLVSGAEGSEAMARSKRIYYLRQAVTLTDDDTRFGNISVSEAVSNQTYILRYLTKGNAPPRIEMKDLKGQVATFPPKGQPALLFFWLPSERIGAKIVSKSNTLCRQYPDLAFFPITAQPIDPARLKEELSALEISQTYTDDEAGSAALAYRVTTLPLAVLVDDKSMIRYIGYPDMKLQTALDAYYHSRKGRAQVISKESHITDDGLVEPNDEVLIQPGSRPQPTPNAENKPAAAESLPAPSQPEDDTEEISAPPLRDMPEF